MVAYMLPPPRSLPKENKIIITNIALFCFHMTDAELTTLHLFFLLIL